MLSIKSDFKSGSLEEGREAGRRPGRPASPEILIAGHAADIEAIQPDGAAFILGVQWHPEKMCDSEERKKLFAAFVENAAAHL